MNIFKTKTSNYNNKNLKKLIILTFILIIIFTYFLLSKFHKNMTNNLLNISSNEIKRITYNILTTKVNNDVLNKESLQDILIINKNNDNEILYLDFNLHNAYQVLDDVSLVLTNSFKELQNGNISIAYLDPNLSNKTESIILNIPMGSLLKNSFLYNLGPKIPVKINFIGSILTNLETKVTDYGLNNALVEVFINIEFSTQIIAPFNTKTYDLKYNSPIASMMIEGRVPSFYNGTIDKQSTIKSTPLE